MKSENSINSSRDRFRGIILGTAVGDSVGLPAEGLGRATIAALGWNSWRQRLFFGKGMISDDTEHTLFVAQSLLAYSDNPEKFQKSLAWKLRLWLLGLPAGIGLGTVRAIIKLWLGFPARKSGVNSAGNGPAMRSAIIGAKFAGNNDAMMEFTLRSTVITHTDKRAFVGAAAVALAAATACATPKGENLDNESFISRLAGLADEEDHEWSSLIEKIKLGLREGQKVADFAKSLGLEKGVGGYTYHTVPVVLYSFIKNYGDFRAILTDVLDCGGDSDTTGAIAGALAGAACGEAGIPEKWIDDIIEYPRSPALLRLVADKLTDGTESKQISYFWPALLLRNIFFLIIVLAHGFLRLVPKQLRKLIFR